MSYFLPLLKIETIADNTTAIWLDRRDSCFDFLAGQNADLNSLRTFSIASSPNEKKYLRFAWRDSDSDFKREFGKLAVGTAIKVDGPFGSFTLREKHDKPIVMLAGGIGITPILSMIIDASERSLPHDITLYYSNKSKERTPFLDELEEAGKVNKNFKFFLGKISDPPKNGVYYISGKPGFVSAMRGELEKSGVDDFLIKTEEFDGY